jgi:multicomponent Na+:H+ antiporter subunit A
VKRLLVVDASLRVLYPAILVLALYFLFAGHNGSGGGFVGGLVAGAAVSLRYVARGVDGVRSAFRVSAWAFLGIGLGMATATAIIPILQGEAVLDHGVLVFHPPLLGSVHLSSTLAFDTGVFLIVVGLVLMVFEAFGDDAPDAPDAPVESTEGRVER